MVPILDRDGNSRTVKLTMMSDWQPYEQPYRPPVRVAHTNGFAVAALACGIGGLLLFPALIVAVVLGHMAHGRIRETGERGYGMATAGIVLGCVGLLIWILFILVYITAIMAFKNFT